MKNADLISEKRAVCGENRRFHSEKFGFSAVSVGNVNFSLSCCQKATTYVVILSEGKQIQKNLLAEVEGVNYTIKCNTCKKIEEVHTDLW